MEHILGEKIEYATIPQDFSSKSTVVHEEVISTNSNNTFQEARKSIPNTEEGDKSQKLNGTIKGETDKALLLKFDNGSEIWVPKSTIQTAFRNEKNVAQTFTIETWILRKNKVPRRDDIHSILIIGSGPIIIGQASEFDYSGTQALKALKEEHYKIILVNSNPATIMTDQGIADIVYIEPLTADMLTRIIERERPDGLLPTLGGQT
ncbi:hypothetical protein LCGC14_2523490, partial [marine sediment metagenome]